MSPRFASQSAPAPGLPAPPSVPSLFPSRLRAAASLVAPALAAWIVLGALSPATAQVAPDPTSLLAEKRLLVINGTDAANTAHGASRRVLSQRLNQMQAQIGFALDSVTGSAAPPTNLDAYDIIVFNYWFHSGYVVNEAFQSGFLPFAQAFKAWLQEPGRRRGWLGVHSSGANEAGEWNWFRDSVSSMRYALHGAGTPAGTIRRTADSAMRAHPNMRGLPDSMRVDADEWYTFTLDAPTWGDVRVLYSLDESTLSAPLEPEYAMDPHPMAWFREDAGTGNRFFYTGLIHENPGGDTPFAHFYAGLILRALEYLGGYAPVSVHADAGRGDGAPGILSDGALVGPRAGGAYTISVHALDGTRLFVARGHGHARAVWHPDALRTPGVYLLRVRSRTGVVTSLATVP